MPKLELIFSWSCCTSPYSH